MKRQLIFPVIGALLGAGCSSQQLLPADTSRFTVDSRPHGATVYVMGKAVGTTPVEVTRQQVFPVSYPETLQNEYGTLTLEAAGCQSYRVPVSNRILEEGLTARLQCHSLPAATEKPAAAPLRSAPSSSRARQRLIELKGLYEEGLINEREYDEKRRSILDEL